MQNTAKRAAAKLDNQPETAGFCKVAARPQTRRGILYACGAKVSAVPPQPPVQKAGSEQTGDLPGTSAAGAGGNAAPPHAAPKPAPEKENIHSGHHFGGSAALRRYCAAVVLKFTVFATPVDQPQRRGIHPARKPGSRPKRQPEVNPDQIDSSDVDLMADGEVSLQGMVKCPRTTGCFWIGAHQNPS